MNTPHALHDEVQTEAPASNCVRMPMQPSEALTRLLDSLTHLQDAILHDTPVTRDDMAELESGLSTVSVKLGDQSLTRSQLCAMPGLRKTLEIWREILERRDNRGQKLYLTMLDISPLTHLTDEIAQIFSTYNDLYLTNLQYISDTQFASIISSRCANLSINAKILRQDQILALSSFKGSNLHLTGFETLTDADAAMLATFNAKNLGLDETNEITDSAAVEIAKFNGNCLSFPSLSVISDEAIRTLSASDTVSMSIKVPRAIYIRAVALNASYGSLESL